MGELGGGGGSRAAQGRSTVEQVHVSRNYGTREIAASVLQEPRTRSPRIPPAIRQTHV
ncbi:hypothetical protein STRIP9103_07148 [Streptomyces ipomoeae 91-03]|uniref:Uncharacterized protein n=1 Tax=Streptomyces ipomoeae 91-03 TaxID=698759 RepID=L1KS19_9ACTN|nr:hypothetical protein STRIP9103_07148 [Streptomyces ipomoeae 91-03]